MEAKRGPMPEGKRRKKTRCERELSAGDAP
jgi:hypothetical protein